MNFLKERDDWRINALKSIIIRKGEENQGNREFLIFAEENLSESMTKKKTLRVDIKLNRFDDCRDTRGETRVPSPKAEN